MARFYSAKTFIVFLTILSFISLTYSQPPKKQDGKVRTMTIPISIFTKEELKAKKPGEYIEAGDLTIKEDGEEQTILSIRSVSENPLSLAVLIQEDLSSSFNLELKGIANFIRHLPPDSRVMIAYMGSGSIQIRQKFTTDLEKAANSLRVVTSSSASAPSSPYQGVSEALGRFDALPTGRRAVLLISDGLDISRGRDSSSPSQSLDLDQAILKAQRKSVAVYSFFTTSKSTENDTSMLVLNAQGSLQKISDETGGRAFFQGTQAPVSFDPFFKGLNLLLTRQFAVTYLSTHLKKGFHKIQVDSTNTQVKIEHPNGYYYK